MIIILTLDLILDHFSNQFQFNEPSHQWNQSDVPLPFHHDPSNDLDHIGRESLPTRDCLSSRQFLKYFLSISRSEQVLPWSYQCVTPRFQDAYLDNLDSVRGALGFKPMRANRVDSFNVEYKMESLAKKQLDIENFKKTQKQSDGYDEDVLTFQL